MVNSQEVKVKKPGFSHVEWEFYHKDGRNLEDNVAAGHREYYQNGVRGVLVPDDPITRIEFNDIHRAEIRTEKVRLFFCSFLFIRIICSHQDLYLRFSPHPYSRPFKPKYPQIQAQSSNAILARLAATNMDYHIKARFANHRTYGRDIHMVQCMHVHQCDTVVCDVHSIPPMLVTPTSYATS